MYNYLDYKTEESEEPSRLMVYISQPMTDRHPKEIELMRKHAEEFVRSHVHTNTDIRFANGYRESWSPEHMLPIEALGRSIQLLSNAGVAYFCPGWEFSKGCRIEHLCCQLYDIPIEYIE